MLGKAGEDRAPFLAFQLFPPISDFLRGARRLIAEDVGMAAQHFLTYGADYILEIEMSLFFCQTRMKHYLQEKIPQLFAKLVRVVRIDGIEHLVRFFEQVRSEGLV